MTQGVPAALDPPMPGPDHPPSCPACGSPVTLPGDVLLGEVAWCGHCGAELELIALTPRRLALYEEEEK